MSGYVYSVLQTCSYMTQMHIFKLGILFDLSEFFVKSQNPK
jgi:hypothetical protein